MAGLGLSGPQVAAVRSNWATVDKNLKQHGVDLFVQVFNKHPDIRALFKRIEGPVADMSKKPQLRAHAYFFMRELGGFVENMDNTEEVICAIKTNARKHHGIRGSTVAQYEVVFGALHDYLRDQLGGEFTADASSGWQQFGKTFCAELAKEYAVMDKE